MLVLFPFAEVSKTPLTAYNLIFPIIISRFNSSMMYESNNSFLISINVISYKYVKSYALGIFPIVGYIMMSKIVKFVKFSNNLTNVC